MRMDIFKVFNLDIFGYYAKSIKCVHCTTYCTDCWIENWFVNIYFYHRNMPKSTREISLQHCLSSGWALNQPFQHWIFSWLVHVASNEQVVALLDDAVPFWKNKAPPFLQTSVPFDWNVLLLEETITVFSPALKQTGQSKTRKLFKLKDSYKKGFNKYFKFTSLQTFYAV